MKPEKLKWVRDEFCFTQKTISRILGISESSYHAMERGSRKIPDKVRNYALALPLLNHSEMMKQHLENIGVELPKNDEED